MIRHSLIFIDMRGKRKREISMTVDIFIDSTEIKEKEKRNAIERTE
jgi:hypothetical protein